jgi:PAS domain S-box-containing protein
MNEENEGTSGPRDERELFRLAIEAAPNGMLLMDRSGAIVLVNAQVEKVFGYPRQELLGKQIEELVPHRLRSGHAGFRRTFFDEPKTRVMGAGRDLFGLRSDGTEVPVEIGLNPLQTSEGDFVLASVVDITERKRSDREREGLLSQLRTLNVELEQRVKDRTSALSATLREREVLLQEIHHRVKNNLQVISSLINMQLREFTGDEGARERKALEECQGRVQAIALVHEKLYRTESFANIKFSGYAKSLAASVFEATRISPSTVALNLVVEDIDLAVDKALPCGLILNELISNALKHGFPNGRRGVIRVELRRSDRASACLVVADDGVGMAAGLDLDKSKSIGMRLVSMLTRQLQGKLDLTREPGLTVRITFPIEEM